MRHRMAPSLLACWCWFCSERGLDSSDTDLVTGVHEAIDARARGNGPRRVLCVGYHVVDYVSPPSGSCTGHASLEVSLLGQGPVTYERGLGRDHPTSQPASALGRFCDRGGRFCDNLDWAVVCSPDFGSVGVGTSLTQNDGRSSGRRSERLGWSAKTPFVLAHPVVRSPQVQPHRPNPAIRAHCTWSFLVFGAGLPPPQTGSNHFCQNPALAADVR